jgi:serine/threonine-protein kinase
MASANPLFLGQIAVKEGHLTAAQLEECLRLQETSDPPRKLGALLIEKKYLTPAALESLMEIQRRRLQTIAADPDRGGLFGQIALGTGYVTQLQLDECLREQHSLAAGGSPVLLGQILLRKAYLTTDQFLEILRRQRKEVIRCTGCDTLYDSHAHPEGAKFVCTRCGTVVQIPFAATEARMPGQESRGTSLRAALHPDIKGQTIGRYVIQEQIGQGGMGVVYKALHRDLNRLFALKILKAGDLTEFDTVKRFQREARLAAKLKHPNIVSVHDAGEEAGIHYIAMEFIEGEPLSARLTARRGRVRDNLVLMEKVVRATAYAHGQGVIHRDLKPANVMVDTEGEPHIMDFGLAKQAFEGSLLTRSGAFLGTPFYMAPEQVAGDNPVVDAQSDVYSLGVILYEILSGRLPHMGANSAETFHRIATRDPIPIRDLNPKIHPDLETICQKAIDRDRAHRYPSAETLAEDLRRHLDGEPIVARPVGPVARLVRRLRKNPPLAVAAVATALLAVAVTALSLSHVRDSQAFRGFLAEARRHREAGRFELAKSALEQALAVYPSDRAAIQLLEEVRLRIRVESEIDQDHKRAEQRRGEAEPFLAEARRMARGLEVRTARTPASRAELAQACDRLERTLEEALARAPDHEEALLLTAWSRLLRGDEDGALRHLNAACASRESLDAAFERGRLLLRKYRRPRGLPELLVREDRPLFTDPAPDSPVSEMYRRDARVDLSHVRTHAKDRFRPHFAEAAMEFLDLRFEAAERKLDSYLDRFPEDAEGLALRALTRLYQNRPDRALADLDRAAALRPSDDFLLDWRAIARHLSGDAEGALDGLRRDGAGAATLCLRGALLLVKGRPAEALAEYQKAVEAAPRWADAFAGRAAAQVRLDRPAEADEDYGRAIALEPQEAAFHADRGLLRLRLGRKAAAAADLERAVELSPARRPSLQGALEKSRGP